jgi:transposase
MHLHGIATPDDIRAKWSRAYLAWLSNLEWPSPADTFTLASLLRSYQGNREELAAVTKRLRQLSRAACYAANFKRLSALRGVGLITAMTFLLEVHDFARFKRSDQFASYLGLTPAQFSSGEHVRLGHITRQGNAYVRGVLVESAWTVIRHDPHLREKYERIRLRGTNGKKAIVAVARSLAIRLRRCLLDETPYVIGVC